MTVLFVALAYGIIGLITSEVHGWRPLAWIVSAIIFAVHVRFVRVRQAQTVKRSALLAALGVGCGAFVVAAAANIHALVVPNARPGLLRLSLIIWPVAIFIPAFLVALMLATVMAGWTGKR